LSGPQSGGHAHSHAHAHTPTVASAGHTFLAHVGTTGGRGRNRGRRRSSQIRLAGNYHFVCAFRFSLFISAFVFPCY